MRIIPPTDDGGLTPPGFITFAMHNPAQVIPGAGATYTWQSLLTPNNAMVNDWITWTDYDPHAAWKICQQGDSGMCHDYAATKRKVLVDAGCPRGALAMAWLHRDEDQRGIDHMVLLARVAGGTMVLDSLTNQIFEIEQIGNYAWISRQAWANPMNWVSVVDPNA